MPSEPSSPRFWTVDEFKDALLHQPLEQIAKEQVFTGLPYVFAKRPEAMETLRMHLSGKLQIAPNNIIVIGSAKVGFSVSPDNFPRAFSDESDIDVLLVDDRLFDSIWHTILKWHYPRKRWLDTADWDWVKERKDQIYWGWLEPSHIRRGMPEVLQPMRDLSTNWFNAFRSLGRYPDFVRRDISGRLYRTWEHALAYQVASLGRVKAFVEEQIAGG